MKETIKRPELVQGDAPKGVITDAMLTVEMDGKPYYVNMQKSDRVALAQLAAQMSHNGQLALIPAKTKDGKS